MALHSIRIYAYVSNNYNLRFSAVHKGRSAQGHGLQCAFAHHAAVYPHDLFVHVLEALNEMQGGKERHGIEEKAFSDRLIGKFVNQTICNTLNS